MEAGDKDDIEKIEDFTGDLVNHEALIKSKALFLKKLEEFHKSSSTKLMIDIGGTILDLHVFYKEVTARGGLVQVIRDGKWTDVASMLGLAKKIPNPSFPLRKHYVDLLYHFERVYYSGTQGEVAEPPGRFLHHSPDRKTDVYQLFEDEQKSTVKGNYQNYTEDPSTFIGKTVTGEIKMRTEDGYIVTMTVGLEKLNGFLYFFRESGGEQMAIIPGLMGGVNSLSSSKPIEVTVKPHTNQRASSGVKRETVKKDPNAPKGARTCFQIFYGEECARLKETQVPVGNTRRMVADAWNSLSEHERQPYHEKSGHDRQRYKQEMAAYMELQKSQAKSSVLIEGQQKEDDEVYIPCYDCPIQESKDGDRHVSVETQGHTNDRANPHHMVDEAELLNDRNRYPEIPENGFESMLFDDNILI
ncbi:hypothetical protein AMTRI_Chr02g263510 [Amborella trichopoda]